MEEKVGGAILSNTVPGNPNKLPGLDTVRPSDGPSGKHSGGDDQRDGHGHRVRLHHPLLGLLRQEEEAQSGPCGDR